MRLWPALLLAPALALGDEAIAYASVGWACVRGQVLVVHAIHALFLVAALATLPSAWQSWKHTRGPGNDATRRGHFLAGLALACAALSALVIAAVSVPAWFIAPCIA